jgi:RNA polymerase sigma factor (TIGR02999 family)
VTTTTEALDDRDVRRLLALARAGDAAARSALFERLLPRLRAIAAAHVRGERRHASVGVTALLGEAWLKLRALELPCADRSEFLSLASAAMRRVLVDAARRRSAAKRDARRRVPLDTDLAAPAARDAYVVALDAALERLAAADPWLARLVELRFFGGLTDEETAEALACGPATVKRAWRLARAFLHREVTRDDG